MISLVPKSVDWDLRSLAQHAIFVHSDYIVQVIPEPKHVLRRNAFTVLMMDDYFFPSISESSKDDRLGIFVLLHTLIGAPSLWLNNFTFLDIYLLNNIITP